MPRLQAVWQSGEALTNIASAPIRDISDIKLSANWMAACGQPGQDAALFDTVKAVGMDLCPELGISIPVGKDSLSMRTTWKDGEQDKDVMSPVSLIVSAFAPVPDVRGALTPLLNTDVGETVLLLIDLGRGKNRMGASALAQVTQQIGSSVPDVDSANDLKAFFAVIQKQNREDRILAYHDRSDGGLFATLCEMAFASRSGLSIDLDSIVDAAVEKGTDKENILSTLFNEELGAVIQIRVADLRKIKMALKRAGLDKATHVLGTVTEGETLQFNLRGMPVYTHSRVNLHRLWSETSWRIARLRDNPECADMEYDRILDVTDTGMAPLVTFDLEEDIAAPFIGKGARPQVAIRVNRVPTRMWKPLT